MDNDIVVREVQDIVKGAVSKLAAQRDRIYRTPGLGGGYEGTAGIQKIIEALDTALWEFHKYLPRETEDIRQGGTRWSGPR